MALLREAREHTTRLRQFAEETRAETDERLTREMIAECGRTIESLEDAKAFWLEVLHDESPSGHTKPGPGRRVGDVGEAPRRLDEREVETPH